MSTPPRQTSTEDWPEEIEEALAELAPKQRDFILAYCGPARLNGRRAAQMVGYGSGSYASQCSMASQTLRILKVQKVRDLILKHLTLSPDEIKAHLQAHVTTSVDDLLGEDGGFDLEKARKTGAIDLIRELQIDEERVTVNDGEVTITRRYRFKLEPKQPALDKLARIGGQYKTTSEVTLKGDKDAPLVVEDQTPADRLLGHLKTLKALGDAGLGDDGDDGGGEG